MRRCRCILTQTLVCSHILLYTHYPSLSLCRYCFAPFYQLNSWKRLHKYQRKIYAGDCILLTKNTQHVFRLLLLCHISELQDNKYTMITVKIRHIFEYEKKICLREKYFIRPLKFIWKTRIYKYIYVYKCGGRVYLGIKCSMLW